MGDGKETYFFYDIPWEKLLAVKRIDIVFLFFLLLILVPYYHKEKDVGMQAVMKSLPEYKRTERYKWLLGIGIAIWSTVLFSGIEFVLLHVLSDVSGAEVIVCSLKEYRNVRRSISLKNMFLIRGICKASVSCFCVCVLKSLFMRLLYLMNLNSEPITIKKFLKVSTILLP